MKLVDTHAHLYLDNFSKDRHEVIEKAIYSNVEKIMLPNIDSTTIEDMLKLSKRHPNHFFPMIGIHPTSVEDDFEEEIKIIEEYLSKEKFYAIGEIGIDMYWDKTFEEEQKQAFRIQLDLAKKHNLPIVIHSRDAFDIIYEILLEKNDANLNGVFHCFTGTLDQANKIIEMGFKLGIGGIVTFKNTDLAKVVEQIDLHNIVLETDSPYLAPDPKRGQRNQSSYLNYIAKKVAEIKGVTIKEVAEITTKNAYDIFKII